MGLRANMITTFLSTLPVRGVTSIGPGRPCTRTYFYPRSPRGERRAQYYDDEYITNFLSTLPARGATWPQFAYSPTTKISIHAPREGSDETV